MEELGKTIGFREGYHRVVIHPGAGWISRRWPWERYAEIIRLLGTHPNLDLIMVGGPEGGASEQEVFGKLRHAFAGKIFDLSGQISLRMLLALLYRSHLFIGNEAGPLHMAGALSLPSVAILGPTRRERTGPFSAKTTVIQKHVSCAPCRNRSCKELTCMKEVSVEEVYEAVEAKLASLG